ILHLLLVQKLGISSPPKVEAEHARKGTSIPQMPFFPNFFLRELMAWYATLGVLGALAALFPWELGVKADPFAPAPAGIRPEWYFLWTFQGLKYLPAKIAGIPGETLGILFLGGLALLFLLVPLLDRKRSRWWDIGAVALLVGAGILTVLSLLPVKGTP